MNSKTMMNYDEFLVQFLILLSKGNLQFYSKLKII